MTFSTSAEIIGVGASSIYKWKVMKRLFEIIYIYNIILNESHSKPALQKALFILWSFCPSFFYYNIINVYVISNIPFHHNDKRWTISGDVTI